MRVEVIIGKMIIAIDHFFIGSHPANWATGTQTRAHFSEANSRTQAKGKESLPEVWYKITSLSSAGLGALYYCILRTILVAGKKHNATRIFGTKHHTPIP